MMDVRGLLDEWAAAEARWREIAATYPSDNVVRACLMSRVGEMARCAKELEEVVTEAGGLLSRSKMSLAIEAVEEWLQDSRRELPPSKMAALVMAVYELIDAPEEAADHIVNDFSENQTGRETGGGACFFSSSSIDRQRLLRKRAKYRRFAAKEILLDQICSRRKSAQGHE